MRSPTQRRAGWLALNARLVGIRERVQVAKDAGEAVVSLAVEDIEALVALAQHTVSGGLRSNSKENDPSG